MSEPGVIKLDHWYAKPPAKVWKALTDPALHALWWAPGDVRAVVGHTFHLDMGQWGKQPCEVVEVVPEKLLKYKFGFNLGTVITWRLVAEREGTRLHLTHEGFDLDSPMGRQAFEGMGAGWPKVLDRMEPVLAG